MEIFLNKIYVAFSKFHSFQIKTVNRKTPLLVSSTRLTILIKLKDGTSIDTILILRIVRSRFCDFIKDGSDTRTLKKENIAARSTPSFYLDF